MKKIISILFVALLSGCATLKPAQLPYVETNIGNLTVDNLRPKNESETEMLSYIITNCNYGIQRLGDEWVQPSKVQYLVQQVSENFPEAQKLTVNNFVTYLNMQYMLREGNIYRGPIWEIFECDENTDQFVTYTPEENPERLNMIIGTLRGDIDGVSFSERLAVFPICPDEQPECTGWDAQADAIKKIVVQLSEKVISKHKKANK